MNNRALGAIFVAFLVLSTPATFAQQSPCRTLRWLSFEDPKFEDWYEEDTGNVKSMPLLARQLVSFKVDDMACLTKPQWWHISCSSHRAVYVELQVDFSPNTKQIDITLVPHRDQKGERCVPGENGEDTNADVFIRFEIRPELQNEPIKLFFTKCRTRSTNRMCATKDHWLVFR